MTQDTREVIRMKVGGIRCRSCERLLALHVRSLEGVEAASVDTDKNELIAFVDPTRVGVNDLARAVVEAGLLPEEHSQATPEATGGAADV